MGAPRSLLPLIAVAIGLGGIVWFVARQASRPTRELELGSVSSPDGEAGPGETADGHRSERAEANVAAPRFEVGGAVAAPAGSDDFVLAHLPRFEPPRTMHASVHGVVVDPLGKPVSGARVLISMARSHAGALLDAPANQGRIKEVESGSSGSFRLSGLDPGPVRLAVRAAGFAPLDAKPMHLVAGDPRDLGELRLEPGLVLAGNIVDTRRAPVPSAQLFLVSAPIFGPVQSLGALAASPLGASEEAGHFELAAIAPGAWTLLVRHPDFPDATFVGGSTPELSRERDLELRLAPSATITGHIVNFDHRTLPLLVVAAPVEGLALFDRTRPPGGNDFWLAGVRTASVEDTGRFEVHGLVPEAQYGLRAMRQDARVEDEASGSDPWAPTVMVRAGDVDCELDYCPGFSLEFQVVDGQSGAPIERMHVSVSGLSQHEAVGKPGIPRTFYPGGRVVLNDLRAATVYRSNEATGSCSIDAPGHEVGLVGLLQIEPGAHQDLGKVELLPLPSYEVRVEQADHRLPISGARVDLATANILPPPSRNRSTGVSRHDGIAHLTSLTSERGILEVTCPGFAPTSVPAPGFLLPGAPAFVVSMSRGARITAIVRDAAGAAIPSATVTLKDAQAGLGGGGSRTQEADASGKALFADLPGGTYLLGARRRDDIGEYQWSSPTGEPNESVALPDAGEAAVELRLKTLSRLSGTVMMGDLPLARALISFASAPDAFADFGGGSWRFEGAPRLRTDAKGEFGELAVVPGEYTLLIDHELLGVLTRRLVRVGEQDTRVVIDIDDTAISGRVLDPGGAPVAGVRVRLFPKNSNENLEQSKMRFESQFFRWHRGRRALSETVSGADGRYRLGAVPPNTSLQVFVREEDRGGLASQLVVRERSTLEQVDIHLVETGGIDIVLAGLSPEDDRKYDAWIFGPNQPDDPGPVRQSVDENHRAHFGHLFPGDWIVALEAVNLHADFGPTTCELRFLKVEPGRVIELKLLR